MKTSKLGIGYDLEIVQVVHKSIEVLATTEEVDKSFWIEFENSIQDDQVFHAELLDGNIGQLTNDDLAEVEAWVEETVVSYLVSESVKVCLRKSNENVYWNCDYHADAHLCISFFILNKKDLGYELSDEQYRAFGETEARTLLNELK